MQKLSTALLGLSILFGAHTASAAVNLVIYHSPSCPHCHHARDFISGTLIKEYPDLIVTEINASDPSNTTAFRDAVKKCKLESHGVPLVVIDDECYQGYGEQMGQVYRDKINAEQAKEKGADATVTEAAQENADTANTAEVATETPTKGHSNVLLFALAGILIIAVAFVVLTKRKKK